MPTKITDVVFYTVEEVAAELEVSPQTVRNYIKQGKLQGKRIGRPVLIPQHSLEDFVKGTPSETSTR